MIGVLLTESAKIQPMGWVLIIGFLVILVVGVAVGSNIDKKNASIFAEEVEKRFNGKKVYGNDNIFITSDNELVIRYAKLGVIGYKLFKLDEIKYIMSCWDFTTKSWHIGLYNENKKLIVGEDHKSSKRILKDKASFNNSSENVEFIEMIMKYVPNAQLVGLYFKEYKGNLKK